MTTKATTAHPSLGGHMTTGLHPRTIDLAYTGARDAYQKARLGVYDSFPTGRPDPALLADWQQELVRKHERAEADLAAVRQHCRRSVPAPRAAEDRVVRSGYGETRSTPASSPDADGPGRG